jgi:hypothetical protein
MKFAILVTLILILGTTLNADSGLIAFHLIRHKGEQAVLEPLIPAKIKVTRIAGDEPDDVILKCEAIPSVGEGDKRTNLLKCGSVTYAVGDIMLSRQ